MNEIGRKIADKLIEIHGSTDFRIAFLPYKRSMWNCMESVYEECQKSGAAAYCIPIPYYRIVQGEIEALDSDRKLFDNGRSISFLEQNKFDFVVIHYPYDDKNKVTRMCSAFYTSELRKYGKVVYIPYSYLSDKSCIKRVTIAADSALSPRNSRTSFDCGDLPLWDLCSLQ